MVVTHQEVVSCDMEAEGRFFLNIDYPSIATSVKVGGSILLDDGLIELVVQKLDHSNKVNQRIHAHCNTIVALTLSLSQYLARNRV